MKKKLIINNLNLYLNRLPILVDINLTINEGDKIGLIGKNGSGKSVLLRVLANIYKPTSGKIIYEDYFHYMSPPNVAFHPLMYLYENIRRYLYFNNQNSFDEEELKILIDRFELSDYTKTHFKNLSQGYKVRLAIVCFLLMKKTNVLIDEFIGFGDKFVQENLFNKIFLEYKKMHTLVVASHNQNLINKICNRIIEIEKGSIINDYRI